MARPPFEITDEVIEKAESLAANGLTKEEIADCLGICYMTLNRQEKANSAFSEAIKRGKSKGIAMMANNLVKLAKGGNAAANIFYMKARARWRENEEERDNTLDQIKQDIAEMKELAKKRFNKEGK